MKRKKELIWLILNNILTILKKNFLNFFNESNQFNS